MSMRALYNADVHVLSAVHIRILAFDKSVTGVMTMLVTITMRTMCTNVCFRGPLSTCAGAKLCMIGDLLGGRGSVTGVDVARDRLATCRTLITKYKVPNCRLFLCDGTTFAAGPPGTHLEDERHSKESLSIVAEGETDRDESMLNVVGSQQGEEHAHEESSKTNLTLQANVTTSSQDVAQQPCLPSCDSTSSAPPPSKEAHSDPPEDSCAPNLQTGQ
eukprot:679218-Pyramimonas_sp.AAC.2